MQHSQASIAAIDGAWTRSSRGSRERTGNLTSVEIEMTQCARAAGGIPPSSSRSTNITWFRTHSTPFRHTQDRKHRHAPRFGRATSCVIEFVETGEHAAKPMSMSTR